MNYTQTIGGPYAPTANLAVNKSRIKVYNKDGDMPTYYLQKGQEFSIELFNPTTDVILAKITLNGTPISQGGLVLNPGQRVYLDRYLDVAKKFLFDTYEVGKSAEVQKAIANNGDFKVQFYKERIAPDYTMTTTSSGIFSGNGILRGNAYFPIHSTGNYVTNTMSTISNNINNTPLTTSSANQSYFSQTSLNTASLNDKSEVRCKSLKSVETGRVEKGTYSDQKIRTVDKEFNIYPFHTVEYKMLPISQKINTTYDINVKIYCTNCGAKLGKTDKFCSSCGNKA